MRIWPNYTRLRSVAIACWTFGSWWIIQLGQLNFISDSWLLFIPMALAGIILLALGIAFWELGTDRYAGILFDSKGIMLNLGHSVAFVAWDNIAEVGVSQHRKSLLDLGSSHQLGLKLHDPHAYIQSYEQRLPASQGPLGVALRFIALFLRPLRSRDVAPTPDLLARTRIDTGYDVLIPEILLGDKAEAFAELVQDWLHNPSLRSSKMLLRPVEAL